jgi:branched-chain amino acid aminotransferase
VTALGDPLRAGVAGDTTGNTPLLWVNGQRADPRAPQLSALDRGFTLADGLFDTMRSYGGVPFRLDAHLARLTSGARTLGIPLPPNIRETVEMAAAAARETGCTDAAVRVTISRGPGGVPGVAPPPDPSATVVIAAFPLVHQAPELYEHGIGVQIAGGRRNERAATAGLKVTAYADAVIALRAARATGADDAVFLDTEGHLSEATASNIFLVHGGTLATPPLTCGALPGITRAAVLECAPSLGIPAAECVLALSALEEADEAFLTSSVRELVPLVRVIDKSGAARVIGRGVPGVVTTRLTRTYADLVRAETRP